MSSSWTLSLPSKRIKAIQNLSQGEQLTNKLREMLLVDESHKIESDIKSSVDGVVMDILGMFENTLSILTSSTHNRSDDDDMEDDQNSEGSGESLLKSVIPVKTKRGCYKRRKNSSTITKVTSNLIDDGYAWRKYGQKVILNAKHQRSYYRCTHKIEQGCKATKQVQKTDDEKPKYTITYNGQHTCKNLRRAPQIILDSPNQIDNLILLNFETNRIIEDTQVSPFFSSMKYNPKEGFPSLGLKPETVTLGEKNHVNPSFYSMKQTLKEGLPSLYLKPETLTLDEKNHVGASFSSMKLTPKDGFPCLGLKPETVTLGENNHVGPSFSSVNHTPKENVPLHLNQEQVIYAFDHFEPWDMIAPQVPQEPTFMTPSGLDEAGIVVSRGVVSSTCSTNGYEIDDMLGSNDFCDFPFELCS